MKSRRHLPFWLGGLSAVLAFILFVGACGPAQPPATPQPTGTPLPTDTPTSTPTPTVTLTPSPTPDPTFPMHTLYFSYGVAVDLFYKDYDEVMGYVDDLGAEWVRQQVAWRDIEGAPGAPIWDEMDNVVAAVGQHHHKLLVTIVKSPSWATADGSAGMPDDPNDLGNFLSAMAARYRGQIQAYEVWNEQNLAEENPSYYKDPGRYVELLKVAYTRIKAADPLAIVLFSPLTPSGNTESALDDIDYLKGAYEYQDGVVRNYFDVLGAHAAGAYNPPDTLWPDKPGPGPRWQDHPSFYFRHVEGIRAVMEAHGDGDKQMWVTEFGWASIEGITDAPAPSFEYAAENTAQQQADYLVQALEMGRTKYQPWMGAMFIWNLNFARTNPPSDQKSAFGLVDAAGRPRPAYDAVKALIAEYTQWP